MFFTCIALAISLSMDSLGIGITYGIRDIKISILSRLILSSISILFTFVSMILGGMLTKIFPLYISNIIGIGLLLFMGIWIIYKSSSSFDDDGSKSIDAREAVALGVALSVDALGAGIGGTVLGFGGYALPLFVAIFQLIFLSLGHLLGGKLINATQFPSNVWTILSGIILILLAVIRICYIM